MKYKTTHLWKNAIRQAEEASAQDAWQKLETSYDVFWDRAIKIAQQISAELPGLTLHDEAHLDAVWETADLIAGEGYPLTPLEVFVFGGAVLLHDLGHTVTAYEGGLAAIKKTPAWRDAVLSRLDLSDDDADPSDEEIENPVSAIVAPALFDVLRSLHAEQAERLCEQSYQGPYGEVSLIDNSELRHHLGQLIGRIAASHHWDREALRHRLQDSIGGVAAAPNLGPIQPVKLACLIRCADACQIDQRRARDFDMALHAPQGVSRDHWVAQNRLGVPQRQEESIKFASTRDFTEDDADAWWVVHDLVQVAHTELQECEALMRDQELPTFRVKSVAGASEVTKLTDHIRAEGWEPVDASLRVSNPKRIIEMFGGKEFYGDALWVPLRELIQNGIDAIEARRALELGFQGRIVIEQNEGQLDGVEGYWLHVSDDGIGMSERVLTRTLVDFGKSAKSGDELKQEFPALRGKRLRPIGQFGIGFFSVMMLSDHVLVVSRPYDQGHQSVKKLRFAWGEDSRPLVLSADAADLSGMSTKVSLFVKAATFEALLKSFSRSLWMGEVLEGVSMPKLLQMIAPLPNCTIYFKEDLQENVEVRSPDRYQKDQAASWLKTILEPNLREIPTEDFSKITKYMTMIKDQSGTLIGWTMLNFYGRRYLLEQYGIWLFRGLSIQAPRQSTRLECHQTIGGFPTFDTGPQRSSVGKRQGKIIEDWISHQVSIIEVSDFSGRERDAIAENVYSFDHDPIKFATIAFPGKNHYEDYYYMDDHSYINIDNLIENHTNFLQLYQYILLSEIKKDKHFMSQWNRIKSEKYFVIIEPQYPESYERNILLPNIILNISFQDTGYRSTNIEDNYCLLGCMHRQCEKRGLRLEIEEAENEFAGIIRNSMTDACTDLIADRAFRLKFI